MHITIGSFHKHEVLSHIYPSHKRKVQSVTFTLTGIDHHSSKPAFRVSCYLLVACQLIKHGRLNRQMPVKKIEMRSYLIIPAYFWLIDCRRVGWRVRSYRNERRCRRNSLTQILHHIILQTLLYKVAEHLNVVPTRPETFGDAEIHHIFLVKPIRKSKLRQHLEIIIPHMAYVIWWSRKSFVNHCISATCHQETVIYIGSWIIVNRHSFIVQAQTCGNIKSVEQKILERSLTKRSCIESRSIERTGNVKFIVQYIQSYRHAHWSHSCIGLVESLVYISLNQRIHTVSTETHRCICLKRLVGHIRACCPIHKRSIAALEGKFFRHVVYTLLLRKSEDAHRRKILVHLHSVRKILISCYGIENKVASEIFDIDSCIEHVPAVTALVAFCNESHIILVVGVIAYAGIHIIVSVFIVILIRSSKVYLKIIIESVYSSQFTSTVVVAVRTVTGKGILVIAVIAFIETCHIKCKTVTEHVRTYELYLTLKTCICQSHLDVCTLNGKRVARIDLY